MAAKDSSSRPHAEDTRAGDSEDAEVAGPAEAGERPGNPSDDVRAILDDMDEALEENAEEIVRSYVQEGGQ
jgi:ubiquitin-like protein Pup